MAQKNPFARLLGRYLLNSLYETIAHVAIEFSFKEMDTTLTLYS